MNFERQLKAANDLLGQELGRNSQNEPIYKWVHSRDLVHLRFQGDKFIPAPGSPILLPMPDYKKVRAYPQLGDRWLLAKWIFTGRAEWLLQFGHSLAWPEHGDYYPTDLLLKPGKSPDLDTTQKVLSMVRETFSISAQEAYTRWEDKEDARDKALHSVIHSIIDDSLTAFGNDPGKRSGGISFGGV